MKSSHVPNKSLNQVHAIFMPDAAQAVNRFPLNLSWRPASTPVLTPSLIFRHLINGSLTLISLILTWSRPAGPFPQRSPPWLLTTAAWGGLKPAPVSRLRGALPHLLCSYAHFMLKVRSWRTCRYQRLKLMISNWNRNHIWVVWFENLRQKSSILDFKIIAKKKISWSIPWLAQQTPEKNDNIESRLKNQSVRTKRPRPFRRGYSYFLKDIAF